MGSFMLSSISHNRSVGGLVSLHQADVLDLCSPGGFTPTSLARMEKPCFVKNNIIKKQSGFQLVFIG